MLMGLELFTCLFLQQLLWNIYYDGLLFCLIAKVLYKLRRVTPKEYLAYPEGNL